MLAISGLTKGSGKTALFRDVCLSLSRNQRVGLIGPPRSGKSMLLRIILGLENYEHGDISIDTCAWFGYLPQDTIPPCDFTVGDVLGRAQQEFQIIRSMTSRRQDQVSESARREVLAGVQLQDVPTGAKMRTLRLDEQRRVWMANLFLVQPDVLVLDDPTQQLTLPVLDWLDYFLRRYPGTLIVASNDRCLLSSVTNMVWEIVPEQRSVREYSRQLQLVSRAKVR
jgi:ATPase subunit of ABC transporter with duplicated ATPase domains